MDECKAICFLNSKKIPKSRFLFRQVVDVIIVFMNSLNAFEETDRTNEALGLSFNLVEFFQIAVSKFEVEVLWDLGAVNR